MVLLDRNLSPYPPLRLVFCLLPLFTQFRPIVTSHTPSIVAFPAPVSSMGSSFSRMERSQLVSQYAATKRAQRNAFYAAFNRLKVRNIHDYAFPTYETHAYLANYLFKASQQLTF